ncbi:MAG: DNA mismatch repair endonuclease MutL [Bacteroidales bacterium]|nr:DNA mismatch repair endonuclease MutL [Bacteroidales bacterium]
MPDVIHLLPDSVANQIAAGEVIQRPASAVKELLENAIDAGADEISLVIKDAGKTLIQVIDNGCGMSETDARMAFERHATSKIQEANDLFAIRTLGFRGEALASIAAIAQVELKSKRTEDELGTCINIAASQVKKQEPCAGQNGTSISIKNLFFNIPARRKFLKSNTTELRHIIDEFHRVTLVNPEIKFSFFNENRPLFTLGKANMKQRIVALMGQAYNSRLIPVSQDSDVINISGFIGKPEFARKTRGEQFFFVNGRFIKHPYLNHAVDNAYKELITGDSFPSYFIFFTIDPKEIDINIHPTKTEVNFQNNQVIYAILGSTIKQSLGKFSITPSIDFDSEPSIDFSKISLNKSASTPTIKINPDYNPFETKNNQKEFPKQKSKTTDNWEKLYPGIDLLPKSSEQDERTPAGNSISFMGVEPEDKKTSETLYQLHNRFIIATVKSGLMVINKQRAYEKILYERFLTSLESGKSSSQQLLFPSTINFSQGDLEILHEIENELKMIGFDFETFGKNTIIINGAPSGVNNSEIGDVLESIIENTKRNLKEIKIDKKINLAKSMAAKLAPRYGKTLQESELRSLIDRLFACRAPEYTPDGKPVLRIITMDELEQKF